MSQCWLAAEPVKWIIAQKNSKFACELAPSTVYLLSCSVDVVRLHCWLTENHPEGKNTVRDYQTSWGCRNVKYKAANKRVWIGCAAAIEMTTEDFVIEKRNMSEVWAGWVMAPLISDRTEHHRNVINLCVIRPNKMVRNLQRSSRLCSEESSKKLVYSDWFWLMMRCVVVWKWSKRKTDDDDDRKKTCEKETWNNYFLLDFRLHSPPVLPLRKMIKSVSKMLPKIKEQIDF